MERKWYYAVDGVRYGPVTQEEIIARFRDGSLKESDLVWQPEFGGAWRSLGTVFTVREMAAPPILAPAAVVVDWQGVAGNQPSAVAAVADAFSRMRQILFRPFDLTRWCSIGFCAWLAFLGAQSFYDLGESGRGSTAGTAKEQFDAVLVKLMSLPEHPKKVAVLGVALLIALLFGLWMCALRSRGDFMFLHRWYKPDASILQCWQLAREAGQALFVWRVLFFLVAALLFLSDGACAYFKVIKPYAAAHYVWNAAWLSSALACATGAVLLGLGVQVVAHLAKAFVVPVMYWHGVSAGRGWLAVLSLCNQHPFAVLGYLVCGIGCWLLVVVTVVAFVLLTCCIGCIPLILPYVGSVMLLPALLFFRGYSVCFMNQWRADLIPAAE